MGPGQEIGLESEAMDHGQVRDKANNWQDQYEAKTDPIASQTNVEEAVEQKQKKLKVIPIKNIKFNGAQPNLHPNQAPQAVLNFGMTQKIKTNSFFVENPVVASTRVSAVNVRDQPVIDEPAGNTAINQTSSSSGNFFQPRSRTNRFNNLLSQPLNGNTAGGSGAQEASSRANDGTLKLRVSKRKTEDSQVRSSLQQTIFNLNQTQTNKIDFHATTSFREAFGENENFSSSFNKGGAGPVRMN